MNKKTIDEKNENETKGVEKEVKQSEVITTSNSKTKERLISIDRFRGLCMFLMVCSFIFGAFTCFEPLAPLIEHGSKGFQVLPGISIADLFAPMFIFVIGLTIVKSFKSREEKFGTRRAYFQLAVRFLSLIGIGILFNGFENAWIDIFMGQQTFAGLSIQLKIYAVMFWIAIALLLVYIISLFFKNQTFKNVALSILRYFLAIAGIFAIYFILVATAEKITTPVGGPRYGGWEWDTLQNIGLAGLLALPFVKYDKWGKLTIVGISFVTLTVLMQNGLFPLANSILEGGIFGAFSWASILLLGSIFADFKDDKFYWVLTSLLLLLSVVLIVGFNFTAAKRGCTPVYAVFCSSISAIIWGLLNFINNWKPKFSFFQIWGSNAILTYFTTLVIALLLGSFASEINLGWAIAINLVVLVVFTVVNWLLKRKNKYIKI